MRKYEPQLTSWHRIMEPVDPFHERGFHCAPVRLVGLSVFQSEKKKGRLERPFSFENMILEGTALPPFDDAAIGNCWTEGLEEVPNILTKSTTFWRSFRTGNRLGRYGTGDGLGDSVFDYVGERGIRAFIPLTYLLQFGVCKKVKLTGKKGKLARVAFAQSLSVCQLLIFGGSNEKPNHAESGEGDR
ncbi:MAG: hypothetical protein BWY82_00248 [Verrucomicrobia bacterium ADurb.Bin474]|nr:MAG: hypothetical protein BWY82_00248 [Verrucomicrobia bacterium ADurb.Bin474]